MNNNNNNFEMISEFDQEENDANISFSIEESH